MPISDDELDAIFQERPKASNEISSVPGETSGATTDASLDAIFAETPAATNTPEQRKTVGGFFANVGKSGMAAVTDFAKGAVDLTLGTLRGAIPGQPDPQYAQAIGGLIRGGIAKILPGEQLKDDEATFNALMDFYKDRYGGDNPNEIARNALNTAYADPIGFLLDVSSVAGGFGAVAKGTSVAAKLARLPGVSEQAARAAGVLFKASEVVDPLSASGKIELFRKLPEEWQDFIPLSRQGELQELIAETAAKLPALVTATTPESIRGIVRLWREDPLDPVTRSKWKAFRDAKFKRIDAPDILQTMDAAIGDIIDIKNLEYNQAKLALQLDRKIIEPQSFFDKFDELIKKYKIDINAETAAERYRYSSLMGTPLDALTDVVDETVLVSKRYGADLNLIEVNGKLYKGGEFNAALFDTFAQQIDNRWKQVATRAGAERAAAFLGEVRTAARDVLETQIPGYKQMTADYAKHMDFLNELKPFTAPKKAETAAQQDARLRRITSIVRDNRDIARATIQRLEEVTQRPLYPQILGVQFKEHLPNLRMQAELGENVTTISGGKLNAWFVMSYPAASPRAWAGFLQGLGMSSRQVQILLKPITDVRGVRLTTTQLMKTEREMRKNLQR